MKYYLFTLLFLISCERTHVTQNKIEAKSFKLLLFASGSCTPCKEELPSLQRWFDQYPNKGNVTPIVYFIAGSPANKPATQEDADLFGKSLGLTFEIRADKYAKKYREYYPYGTAVPAVVITNEKGTPVKIFAPGKVTHWQIEAYIE